MSFSHSKVETHHTCPYKYKLRYVDKLEPKPDLRPSNALYIGTAVHEGIEHRSIEKAFESYKSNYPEISKENELELYKIKKMLEIAIPQIPEGIYEFKIRDEDGFIGFIDMLVEVEPGVYDLYDFKTSNSASRYKQSTQVHVYKYYYEKLTGHKVRNLYYAMVPKSTVKLEECESYEDAIQKVDKFFEGKSITFVNVVPERAKVGYFFARKNAMDASDRDKNYTKIYSTMCKFCEYQKYCSTNGADRSELVEKESEFKEVALF